MIMLSSLGIDPYMPLTLLTLLQGVLEAGNPFRSLFRRAGDASKGKRYEMGDELRE